MKSILTLSIVVVSVCALRFLFDGVSFNLLGHLISIPHTDSMAYGSILTPVLGAHGWIHGKHQDNMKAEDPDAN